MDLKGNNKTMIPVVDKKDVYEASYRLETGVYIKFIEKNSDMNNYDAGQFVYIKGYLSYEDEAFDGTQTELHKAPNEDRIKDHGVDYEYEFYKAHPFFAKRGVVFFFND